MDVTQLHDALPPYGSSVKGAEVRKTYGVIAITNPGDGPDEQVYEIEEVTWDDEFGVMRLELIPRSV